MCRPVSRHLCLGCRSQRARFRYRGRVRADRDHTLCFRCYRSMCNRLRAERMVESSSNSPSHMPRRYMQLDLELR